MQPIPAKMLLAGLAEAGSVGSETITAVVTDSRAVCPGCVFVCFPGQRVDGHDFAAKAVAEGAPMWWPTIRWRVFPRKSWCFAPAATTPWCAWRPTTACCFTPE